REFPQQRALADPSGTVHEHDRRGLIVGQAPLEQVELGLATHEPLTVAVRQPCCQRYALGPRTSRTVALPLVAHDLRSVAVNGTLLGSSWTSVWSVSLPGPATSRRSARRSDCRGRT